MILHNMKQECQEANSRCHFPVLLCMDNHPVYFNNIYSGNNSFQGTL